MGKFQKANERQFTAMQYAPLTVQAYSQWLLTFPMLFVSVMHADGNPVKDLKKANFHAGRIGNGATWVPLTITTLQTDGNAHGFYSLSIQKNSNGGQLMNWNFFPDQVLTIEVSFSTGTKSNKVNYRGQCLAAMQTKEK
ncbi:MAG: hypothetical protein R2794_02385 [Chitinophagales bacterium]